jgi:hypothetical protein
MPCSHTGFHSIDSAYDRRSGTLVFFWKCDRCGARLREACRQRYRPMFDRLGNERYRRVASRF